MSDSQVLVETHGPVRLITLNRPDRLNAWTRRMYRELVDAVQAANDDQNVGAIVITGAGRAFCAGADIREAFASPEWRDEAGGAVSPDVDPESDTNWPTLLRRSKPVVAAVNGVAVGVGLTMTLSCDVRLASPRAEFGAFFIKVGLVPELASSHLLVQLVGLGHATEMCLTGRLYSSAEAERIGLVSRVVPAERLLDEALRLAAQIAANPQPHLGWIKEMLAHNAASDDLKEILRIETKYLDLARKSPQHAAAVQAFLARRRIEPSPGEPRKSATGEGR
jgi:2-(1,2-epoxy-1,2-dihydrophenyl)acetyl-CoA isomerase